MTEDPRDRARAAAEARARVGAVPPPGAPSPVPAAAAVPEAYVLPPHSEALALPPSGLVSQHLPAAPAPQSQRLPTSSRAPAGGSGGAGGSDGAGASGTSQRHQPARLLSEREVSTGRMQHAATAPVAQQPPKPIQPSRPTPLPAESAGSAGKKRARPADAQPPPRPPAQQPQPSSRSRSVIHLDGPAQPAPWPRAQQQAQRQPGSHSDDVVDLRTPPASPTRNGGGGPAPRSLAATPAPASAPTPAPAPAPANRDLLLGYRDPRSGTRVSGRAHLKLGVRAWQWLNLSAALSSIVGGGGERSLSGFLAASPDKAALQPGGAEGKKLVGRSVLYHWADVGWCSGVIEKANGDKSKTVDGDMVNFEIYYEMDDDLSRHVLEMDKYLPDGPPNSWVLLEVADVVVAAEIVAAEVPADAAADPTAADVTPAEEVEVQVTIDA